MARPRSDGASSSSQGPAGRGRSRRIASSSCSGRRRASAGPRTGAGPSLPTADRHGRSPARAARAAAGSGIVRDGATFRLHAATAQVDATVRRGRGDVVGPDGTLLTRLHLAEPIAVAASDRFALRRSSPAAAAGGGIVLDPQPPAGPSRRHADTAAAAGLWEATAGGHPVARDRALLALHGALPVGRVPALVGARPATPGAGGTAGPTAGDDRGHASAPGRDPSGRGADIIVAGPVALSPAVAAALDAEAVAAVSAHHAAKPDAPGLPLVDLRRSLARALRRRATVTRADAEAAASAMADALVASGRLARDGDLVRDPGRTPGPPPALVAAMDRLVAALSSAAPPPFDEAVRASGCPPEGVRLLEQGGRIVRLAPDLAFAAETYRDLSTRALDIARAGPLTPAAFRDATGSSRRYALAILEDLDRRQVLRRGPDGHVVGPRAPRPDGGPA
jgi:selenocysteine-specific elongation factor